MNPQRRSSNHLFHEQRNAVGALDDVLPEGGRDEVGSSRAKRAARSNCPMIGNKALSVC
jgi:hypothetical protein